MFRCYQLNFFQCVHRPKCWYWTSPLRCWEPFHSRIVITIEDCHSQYLCGLLCMRIGPEALVRRSPTPHTASWGIWGARRWHTLPVGWYCGLVCDYSSRCPHCPALFHGARNDSLFRWNVGLMFVVFAIVQVRDLWLFLPRLSPWFFQLVPMNLQATVETTSSRFLVWIRMRGVALVQVSVSGLRRWSSGVLMM